MNLIRKAEAPVFTMAGLTVTGLASPRRGAMETCVWRVRLAPSSPGVPHSVTREEIFVGLQGTALVTIDGAEHVLGPGDAIIVPPNTPFSLANPSSEPFEAVVSFPVGGKAVTTSSPFTPPWAE
jgi:quercetin dioxygenase-like cupin family protein